MSGGGRRRSAAAVRARSCVSQAPPPNSPSSIRAILRGVATVLAAAAVGLVVAPAIFGSGSRLPSLPPVRADAAPRSYSVNSVKRPTLTKYTTIIATVRGSRLRVYRTVTKGAGARAATAAGRTRPLRLERTLRQRVFNGQRFPLVLEVTDRRPGWLRVRLPSRPNGRQGWVRRSKVNVSATNWRVKIQLRRHRIVVFHGRVRVLTKPIGVGRSVSPTPKGKYYVTDLVKSTKPKGFYGPYSLGLSAYSRVYSSFGSGDGQIGIHGTNNPGALGTDVSHGCIRVKNAVIRKLAHDVPLGTPVSIER